MEEQARRLRGTAARSYGSRPSRRDGPFSGAGDDIWKAYDCIPRQLAITVACAAGFPRPLAKAYSAFHDGWSYTIG